MQPYQENEAIMFTAITLQPLLAKKIDTFFSRRGILVNFVSVYAISMFRMVPLARPLLICQQQKFPRVSKTKFQEDN